jgi:hypothetical protein
MTLLRRAASQSALCYDLGSQRDQSAFPGMGSGEAIDLDRYRNRTKSFVRFSL